MGDSVFIWLVSLILCFNYLVKIFTDGVKFKGRKVWRIFGVYIIKKYIVASIFIICAGQIIALMVYTAIASPTTKNNPVSLYYAKIVDIGAGRMGFGKYMTIELLDGSQYDIRFTSRGIDGIYSGRVYLIEYTADVVDAHVIQEVTPLVYEGEINFAREHDSREMQRFFRYERMRNRISVIVFVITIIIDVSLLVVTSARKTRQVKKLRHNKNRRL